MNFGLSTSGTKNIDAKMRKYKELLEKAVMDELKNSADMLKRQYIANLEAHKKTGKLKESVFSKSTNRYRESAIIGSTSMSALYLEVGTRGHFVSPKKARVLSWVDFGKRFFSKGHMVSGIRGQHHLQRAYNATIGLKGKRMINRFGQRVRSIKV